MDTDSFKLSSFLSQGQTVDNFGNEIVLLESPCYERWYDFPFSSDSTICIIVNSERQEPSAYKFIFNCSDSRCPFVQQPFRFWKIFQKERRSLSIGI